MKLPPNSIIAAGYRTQCQTGFKQTYIKQALPSS